MTVAAIPNRPLGSDVRAISQITANFDALIAVINGQLDSSNLANNGVTTSKILDANVTRAKFAPDALQTFLQLVTPASRKLNFGTFNPGSWGGVAVLDPPAVSHGLTVVPVFAIALGLKATVSSVTPIPITSAVLSSTASTVSFRLRTGDGGATSNADSVTWLAIG